MSVTLGSSLDKIKTKAQDTINALNEIISDIDKYQQINSKDTMIFELRQKGLSFNKIGQMVGISGTAARNRFQKIIDKGETIDL